MKKDARVAQEVDGEFTVSQPSSATAYLHVTAHTTQANVTFELYSNTGAVARDSATVRIDAGEVRSIALHHRVTSNEKLTIRILGTGLDLSVAPESRVEVRDKDKIRFLYFISLIQCKYLNMEKYINYI